MGCLVILVPCQKLNHSSVCLKRGGILCFCLYTLLNRACHFRYDVKETWTHLFSCWERTWQRRVDLSVNSRWQWLHSYLQSEEERMLGTGCDLNGTLIHVLLWNKLQSEFHFWGEVNNKLQTMKSKNYEATLGVNKWQKHKIDSN